MSNSLNGRKVAVIGCGFVGSTTAYSLMQSKLFTDMVLIDVDTNRAEGEALDISHGIPYYSPMNIYAGTYEDLSDASIVIITAGANQKPGETRLDLVQKNVAIFKTIVPRIMEQGFDGIFLVVSNPVDILTQVVMELSGLPRERVMGSGTVLDSARLKYTLGHMLDNQPAILWVAVLNKRSLHCFFMRRAWAVHFFHGARVDPCEIDTRGNGTGRWIEVLHLFGVKAHIAAELRQLYSLF